MLLNSREFKFLKNYNNVYVKSSAKLITLLILIKKEFISLKVEVLILFC